MNVTATLFDPSTGKRCTVEDDYDWSTAEGAEFVWTEGNYSCDCNRKLFMARAGVPGYHEDDKVPCGNTVVLESLLWRGRDLLSGP